MTTGEGGLPTLLSGTNRRATPNPDTFLPHVQTTASLALLQTLQPDFWLPLLRSLSQSPTLSSKGQVLALVPSNSHWVNPLAQRLPLVKEAGRSHYI